jgi:hypothetical protein
MTRRPGLRVDVVVDEDETCSGKIVACHVDGSVSVQAGDDVVTVPRAQVDAGSVRCSKHDVKEAVRHRHVHYAGAAVPEPKITRCRVSAQTTEHLMDWIARSHKPVAASARNTRRGARYERPVSRNKMYVRIGGVGDMPYDASYCPAPLPCDCGGS